MKSVHVFAAATATALMLVGCTVGFPEPTGSATTPTPVASHQPTVAVLATAELVDVDGDHVADVEIRRADDGMTELVLDEYIPVDADVSARLLPQPLTFDDCFDSALQLSTADLSDEPEQSFALGPLDELHFGADLVAVGLLALTSTPETSDCLLRVEALGELEWIE